MVNMPKDWDIAEYKDVYTINCRAAALKAQGETGAKRLEENAQRVARDHARTPMNWDSSGGFSTSDKPWMRSHSFEEINAEQQESDPSSVLNYYRQLYKLRQTHQDVFIFGRYEALEQEDEKTMVYKKHSPDGSKVAVVCLNFSSQEQKFQTPIGADLTLLVGNMGEGEDRNVLRPWEARVYLSGA